MIAIIFALSFFSILVLQLLSHDIKFSNNTIIKSTIKVLAFAVVLLIFVAALYTLSWLSLPRVSEVETPDQPYLQTTSYF